MRKGKPPALARSASRSVLPLPRKGGCSSVSASAPLLAGAQIGSGEEDEQGEEEDEESEDTQVCWSVLFSCFPLIWTIGAEFATEAIESGIAQHITLLMLPLIAGIKSLFTAATQAKPPKNAPPAPPMPPVQPDIFTATSTAIFGYAESHPVYYLLVDFGSALFIGLAFLFWKDINDWVEKVQSESRQAADRKARLLAAPTPGPETMHEDTKVNGESVETGELVEDKSQKHSRNSRISKDWAAMLMREELKQFLQRRDELQRIVNGVEVTHQEEDLNKKKQKQTADKFAGVGSGAAACLARAMKGPVMQRAQKLTEHGAAHSHQLAPQSAIRISHKQL